jgi:hypothetical protein
VDNNQRYLCRRKISFKRKYYWFFGEGFVMVETLDTALQIVWVEMGLITTIVIVNHG